MHYTPRRRDVSRETERSLTGTLCNTSLTSSILFESKKQALVTALLKSILMT